MTNYLFQRIIKRGKAEGIDDTIRQRDTRTWFREQAMQITRVDKNKMMIDKGHLINRIEPSDIGSMFMYFYDPKHKDTLPYYDIFPLIFPVDFTDNGMLALNLHYLPPVARAALMDKLYTIASDRKFDTNTKLNLSYGILKDASKFKLFKPCIKRYLWSHVGSKFLKIEPRLWDFVLMLPAERFKKATRQTVWNESMNSVK